MSEGLEEESGRRSKRKCRKGIKNKRLRQRDKKKKKKKSRRRRLIKLKRVVRTYTTMLGTIDIYKA